MPLSPASVAPSPKRPSSGKSSAPSETGSSTSSQRASMQQMLRQLWVRPTASQEVDQASTGPWRQAQAAAQMGHTPLHQALKLSRPKPVLRLQSAPAAAPATSWPMALRDEAEHEELLKVMRAFDDKVHRGAPYKEIQTSRACALEGITNYQQYLRYRVAEVSTQLQAFKQQHEAVLAASPVMQESLRMFKDINGPSVLFRSHAQSPFVRPEVMAFLAEQEAREEALMDTIERRVAAIRRSHAGVLTPEACRAQLMQDALQELVEKDLIQYYLEMTLLTRCQLTAGQERARLREALPTR